MGERPECWTVSKPKARKEHTCEDCTATIGPGDKYTVFSGVWSFGPARYKICAKCWAIRDEYEDAMAMTFGDLGEFLIENRACLYEDLMAFKSRQKASQ